MPEEKWLTAQEAASLLGVSDRTLRRYVQQKKLTKHTIATGKGNEPRFSEDEVLQLKSDMTAARLQAGQRADSRRPTAPPIAGSFDIVKFLDKYEAAIQQLGYLRAKTETVKMLEEKAGSLQQKMAELEAEKRTLAEALATERVQSRRKLRTAAWAYILSIVIIWLLWLVFATDLASQAITRIGSILTGTR